MGSRFAIGSECLVMKPWSSKRFTRHQNEPLLNSYPLCRMNCHNCVCVTYLLYMTWRSSGKSWVWLSAIVPLEYLMPVSLLRAR